MYVHRSNAKKSGLLIKDLPLKILENTLSL